MVWEREIDLFIDGAKAIVKATGEIGEVMIAKQVDAGTHYYMRFPNREGVHSYFYTDIILLWEQGRNYYL